MKTRREMCREEMTRDPIFLLQVRGSKREHWITESVFLSREEGQAFGESHAYRWGEWRVYCIPCDGELARILDQLDTASP
jgi:hypothetical protein